MAQRTRHALDSSGAGQHQAIVNAGYLSDYYFAYRLESGLSELYKSWDERERGGESTPRTALKSLSTAFSRLRAEAAATGVNDPAADDLDGAPVADAPRDLGDLAPSAVAAQRELNDAALAALGWPSATDQVELVSANAPVTVPACMHRVTPSGSLLIALGTVFGDDPGAAVASKTAAAGTLLSPLMAGDSVVARTALEAAHVIFTAESPPTYILVVSGGSVTLLDRERWGEGVYLGANLEDAVARADQRPKGELAAIAALFSADAVDPGPNAQSALAQLLDKAASESAGVSKELRHGVRRSVEVLASAVVRDIAGRQKKAWTDIDADDLTRQCLRYIYRVIVLLFAEARPELGILPVNDTDYQAGYSVSRLRDLALVDVHGEQSRNSTHIQQSLARLFALVDAGYAPPGGFDDDRTLEFPRLDSALFGHKACPMLDGARIDDPTMQAVLANLCFTREQSGRQRQSLSYATLGINQLGAVYEGLMAYRGFLATEPLHEVDNDGDPDSGTWVVPVSAADEYPAEVFVTVPGSDGVARRVTYDKGEFVFRLAGRDRQRSASYYTPEVLTEFTVRHALDVYEEENPEMTASDWLGVTVCEPALGSGAFANEAVNQLAVRYLRAAQRERGTTIDPDRYQVELQRAKAHFALNRTYGVDLNGTAVELAEVSLWLNVMHEGLSAPQFGARLRRGNSLIGARRAVYSETQVSDTPWKKSSSSPVMPPVDVPLSSTPLGSDVGIHHFLVPGEGWGCAADAVELKGKKSQTGLAEEWSASVREWRKSVQKAPSASQIGRLVALSRRVEQAWHHAATNASAHLRGRERRIAVWGADDAALPPEVVVASSEEFDHPEGPVARLRLLMDAWCALWLWAPANGAQLPSFEQWLDAAELLLGQPTAEDTGQLFSGYQMEGAPIDSVEFIGKAMVNEIVTRHPWLEECRKIAAVQAFFHWELEFAPVFQRGGFDLQVGNPPWVRPTWDEPASLAEHDPWWGITNLEKTAEKVIHARREKSLQNPTAVGGYVADRAENAGVNSLLASVGREPLLKGIQTNLYMNFMTNAWRRSRGSGVVGLVHPESHFVDPGAGGLRTQAYHRLRRHWQFSNEKKLFADPGNTTEFGVHVYAGFGTVNFTQAVNLLSPATLDRSLLHNGEGELPSIQFPEGGWDLRPHAKRIVTVTEDVLAQWVSLFDPPGTPATESRLLRPLTQDDLGALAVFARQPTRLGQLDRRWTRGFDEDKLKREGTGEAITEVPSSLGDCILQGPHILNATPFAQQPRTVCKTNKDWDSVNLEDLPSSHLPRTNFQRLVSTSEFEERQQKWDNRTYSKYVREAHRDFVNPTHVRTIKSCLLPVGVPHIYTLNSIHVIDDRSTCLLSGLMCSLPYDFLIKAFGITHLTQSVTDGLVLPRTHEPLEELLLHRTLRLNCLLEVYAPLWKSLYDSAWSEDEFVAGEGTTSLASASSTWTPRTPLRTDLDRWLALCEIDVIVALLLGLSEDQLLQMYRSQFAVLRKYEYVTVFDANGRQISGHFHNHGFVQAEWEADYKTQKLPRGATKMGMWDRVVAHSAGDTSVDLGPFVPPFVPADREGAMSRAYRAFAAKVSRP